MGDPEEALDSQIKTGPILTPEAILEASFGFVCADHVNLDSCKLQFFDLEYLKNTKR